MGPFRAGMLGLTVHLRQRDLAATALPGTAARRSRGAALPLAYGRRTIYAGGGLRLGTDGGWAAGMVPGPGGSARPIENLLARDDLRLAADGTTREVIAAGDQGRS